MDDVISKEYKEVTFLSQDTKFIPACFLSTITMKTLYILLLRNVTSVIYFAKRAKIKEMTKQGIFSLNILSR